MDLPLSPEKWDKKMGQRTGYRGGQRTEDRLQITEAPSYNKSSNLEILQDNKSSNLEILQDNQSSNLEILQDNGKPCQAEL